MTFRVALGQASTSEDKRENLRKGLDLIKTASERRADLLILPELFMAYVELTAPADRFLEVAESIDGEFVSALAAEARRRRMHVAAGIIEKSKSRGKVHNTIVLIGPDGRLVAAHRKLQLFDSFGYSESSRFAPAETVEGSFRTKLARMGMMTCYELRFPEIARILAFQGAEFILVPTAWVQGRMKEDHLRVFARARALENTVFVAVASQTGRIFTGRSTVVDPFGVPVCDAGEEEGVTVCDVDLGRVRRVRKVLASLGHVRYDVYSRFQKDLLRGRKASASP